MTAVLLLDAGDLIGDTMIADLTKGEALISPFNSLNYDAMTFGNHEPDFGVDVLRKRVEQCSFPSWPQTYAAATDRYLPGLT